MIRQPNDAERERAEPDQWPELRVDVMTGQVLLGRTAVSWHYEVGGHPADTPYLSHFLRDRTIPLPAGIPRRDDPLTREDAIQEVKDVAFYAREIGARHRVTRDILDRASTISLSHGAKIIKSTPGVSTMSELYQAALPDSHQDRVAHDIRYSVWLQEYAKVVEELDRLPTESELRELRRAGRNVPTRELLQGVNRTFGDLAMRVGRVYPQAMSNLELELWGVRFAIANDGRLPDAPALNSLSPHDFAPPTSTIVLRHQSIRDYQARVEARLRRLSRLTRESFLSEVEREQLRYDPPVIRRGAIGAKLRVIDEEIAAGLVPRDVLAEKYDRRKSVELATRFRIVNRILPQSAQSVADTVFAARNRDDFYQRLHSIDPSLRLEDIRAAAAELEY